MEKLKKILTGILAVFGVLFILLLLLPDDEDAETSANSAEMSTGETGSAQDHFLVQNNMEGGHAADGFEVTTLPDGTQIICKDGYCIIPENYYMQMAEHSGEVDAESIAGSEAGSGSNTADGHAAENNTTENNMAESDTTESNLTEGNAAENNPAEGNSIEKGSTTIVIPDSERTGKKISFRTSSLNGGIYDEGIFGDYDLTMVHIWGTFCNPCVDEMDQVAELYQDLPSNVNMVGIICDVYDGISTNVKTAGQILSEAGADFVNLRVSDSLYDVMRTYGYVPTTLFVDKNGEIIGDVISYADVKEYEKRINSYCRE